MEDTQEALKSMPLPVFPAVPAVAATTLAVADSPARFPIRRVFCIGRNYWWQEDEKAQAWRNGQDGREPPFFFMKPADAVVPASHAAADSTGNTGSAPAAGRIPYPPATTSLCHEVELVVAIGRDGVHIPREQALSHVWGYTVGLDLTRRDQQLKAKEAGRPWEGSKAFDASAPTAPIVPVHVSGHPVRGAITLSVNGKIRQSADLGDQIWQPQDLIHFLSQSVTLRAGDLIFTGTPVGVGPLQRGDTIAAAIAGIGALSVTIA